MLDNSVCYYFGLLSNVITQWPHDRIQQQK